eukprot:TRINITY_DN1179_c1_g1_i5.p1 TRINITY_DN1179_c1_g1~~TRINITY_DN1179_c1_g1_i5.p1  ORF type:complete len:110 (-),score=0.61 TRINITY_DN1179_c1_g1_i5:1275-1604(-)
MAWMSSFISDLSGERIFTGLSANMIRRGRPPPFFSCFYTHDKPPNKRSSHLYSHNRIIAGLILFFFFFFFFFLRSFFFFLLFSSGGKKASLLPFVENMSKLTREEHNGT